MWQCRYIKCNKSASQVEVENRSEVSGIRSLETQICRDQFGRVKHLSLKFAFIDLHHINCKPLIYALVHRSKATAESNHQIANPSHEWTCNLRPKQQTCQTSLISLLILAGRILTSLHLPLSLLLPIEVNHQQLLVILPHSGRFHAALGRFHRPFDLVPQSFLAASLPEHILIMHAGEPKLTIFHFNDVYNIQPYQEEPKAGAAYFQALLQREKAKYLNPITLFSGDAFSPSLISTEFEGQNMIKPLNAFGIDLACFGNHDLDYELEHVMQLVKQTNFPWLLSNVYDVRTGRRLAEGLQTYIMEREGMKIGYFSLAEKEWIDTLYPYYKQICDCIPFIEFANQMVFKLRNEMQCDIVIALTHMMKYNDIKLAQQVKGIDLILGGHDHMVAHQMHADLMLVKSGTDFRHFSIIRITDNHGQEWSGEVSPNTTRHRSQKWMFEIQLKEVHHEKEAIVPDAELDTYIVEIYQQFKEKQEKTACYTVRDLDLRFSTIRKEQSPFLEFLVSIYRHESGADVAMMNSGNFRMDTIVKAGPVTFGVIENIITDRIIVKLIPGHVLLEALENCVSMYPNLAGRYSAFSGISFNWDSAKQPGHRVVRESIFVHEEPLNLEHVYKVAVHSFAGDGGDGFGCLKACETIASDGDKYNRQLLHDLLHMNHYLLDSYLPKYPGRYNIIEVEGHKYLQLTLPQPKNVHMITSL